MIIDTAKPVIETGGETTYEESFAIGNIGRIMGILRNSMYANPIKAIVREIASNARDAHREVGNDARPIEIHLPNDIDEHFYIKDYGPGISPERMSNVFIRYGSSTKNDDNCQTGGFGLGAKTPFAYTDQFQITTITPSDVGNVKRIYIAYIDESETGKMRLMAQSPTNEETGTEISLVVKEDDFYKFTSATLEVCQYWNPRPNLKGRAIPDWPTENRKVFLRSNKWTLFSTVGGCYKNFVSYIIVDGIHYPINPKNIDDCSNDVSRLLNTGIEIIANTGDVSLSANREELQYDLKTQEFLLKRIENIFSSIQESLVKNIQQNESYRNAVIFLRSFKDSLGFTIPDNFAPEWNGNKVVDSTIRINNTSQQYIASCFYMYKNRKYQNALTKKETNNIRIESDSVIVFNDLHDGGISRSRIQYLIESGKCKSVYVFSFPGLNVDDGIAALKNDIGVDPNLLEPIKISSINVPRKARTRRGCRGSGRANYKAFVFDKGYSAYRQCDHFWRPTELDLEDGEGVYVVSGGRSNEISSQGLGLTPRIIEVAINYVNDSDLSIYAIRERDLGKLGSGWTPFKQWIESQIEDELNEKNITAKEVVNAHSDINSSKNYNHILQQELLEGISFLLKNSKEKISPNSAMAQYLNYINELESKFSNKRLNELLLFLGHEKDQDLPLVGLVDNLMERYPLLSALNRWAKLDSKHILQYIMLIDAEYDRQQILDKGGSDDYPMAVNG